MDGLKAAYDLGYERVRFDGVKLTHLVDGQRVEFTPEQLEFIRLNSKDSTVESLRHIINIKRLEEIESLFEYKGKLFDACERSIANMQSQLLEIDLDPTCQVVWIADDDTPVPMTHEEFKEFALLVGKRKKDLFLKANIIKTNIASMPLEELESLDPVYLWENYNV